MHVIIGMLGIQRIVFFGKVASRRIIYKNTLNHVRYLSCSSRYIDFTKKNGDKVKWQMAVTVANKLVENDKNVHYYVRYLSCSNRYIYFTKQNDDIVNKNDDKVNKNDKINKNDDKINKNDDKLNTVVNKQAEKDSRIRYIYKKIRFVIDVFLKGCKSLFSDVRIALRIRRKLGLYHQRDYSKLTREEVRHIRQTREDLVKTLPVALLFMIPFIGGYAAPILAYFYPKQLLSQQFWHPDQKKEFILEEYEKRSQYYLPLIKEVAVTCKEIKSRELYKLCLQVINGRHPDNAELLHFKDIFMRFEDFSLQSVPRYHLVKLCKCWLIPTGWYLPRWYLMNALRRRISHLHEDDMLILKEGIDTISSECISQAVHVRGLDKSSLNLSSEIIWLTEWINLSSQVSDNDISFLAHCSAFKSTNFEKTVIENGVLPKQ